MALFLNVSCISWPSDSNQAANGKPGLSFFNRLWSRLRRARSFGLIKVAALSLSVGLVVYLYLLFGFDLAQQLWYANATNRNLKAINHQIFKPVQALLPPGQKPLLILLPL